MHVIYVNIVKLHEAKCFLELKHRIWINVVEWFSGNKQILPFAPILRDHCFDSLAEWYLVVVVARSVDVLAVAHLQSSSQKIGQYFFILQFVGTEA